MLIDLNKKLFHSSNTKISWACASSHSYNSILNGKHKVLQRVACRSENYPDAENDFLVSLKTYNSESPRNNYTSSKKQLTSFGADCEMDFVAVAVPEKLGSTHLQYGYIFPKFMLKWTFRELFLTVKQAS